MCIFVGEFRCQNRSMLLRGHFDVAADAYRSSSETSSQCGRPRGAKFRLYAQMCCAIENLVGRNLVEFTISSLGLGAAQKF